MINKFEQAKKILKETFFGIDEQIDQVVKAFETWETVHDYQVRPMTVCLWGLTGTGKTALINKTIELLDLNKKKFYIKFGSKTSGLDDDFRENSCEDTIFILDEFQYFKTKTESGDEIARDEDNSTNVIWELLDGGVVNLYGTGTIHSYEIALLLYSVYSLREFNRLGAKIKGGIVSHPNLRGILKKLRIETEEPNDFSYRPREEMVEQTPLTDNASEISLGRILDIGYSSLFSVASAKELPFTFNTKNELIDYMATFSDFETLIAFLETVRKAKPKLEIKDYSKSLIFVIGNLDECFTMSNDLTSDLDADYFYNQTKKINIINVRKSLLTRFRAEQIARLGSTHIIYPSLNKKAFEQIINKELVSFKDTIITKFPNNIKDVLFTESIRGLIYKEGVFPIIGARSIFSTITEIISDKFVNIIKMMLQLGDKSELIVKFDYSKYKSNIIISIIDSDNNVLDSNVIKYVVKVDNLRTETNKGKQAHIAVHEAGHAVCSIALEKIFPEVIYSVVLAERHTGFNLFNTDEMYFDKIGSYIKTIAKFLGGYAAEEYLFGQNNISNGSASDIRKATQILSSLFKDSGFLPGTIGHFVSKHFTSTMFETSNYSVTDNDNQISIEVQSKLNEALTLAKETLRKERLLLLKISEYLSKNPKITRKKLKELTEKYAVTITLDEINKNKEEIYYNTLNTELQTLNNKN